jgi:hypothetical protein
LHRLGVDQAGHLGRHGGAEPRGDARSQILADGGRGRDDHLDVLLLDDLDDGCGVRVREVVRECGRLDGDDVDAVGGEVRRQSAVLVGQNDGERLPPRAGPPASRP